MLAERYFAEDPNTALLKLRQFAELLAQIVATKVGLYTSHEEAQFDLLRRLQDQAASYGQDRLQPAPSTRKSARVSPRLRAAHR